MHSQTHKTYQVERLVLGSILQDPSQFIKVFEIIGINDFNDQLHKRLFAAMIGLYEDKMPIDLFLLERRVQYCEGDQSVFLYGCLLIKDVSCANNAIHYAAKLKEDNQRNLLNNSLYEIIEQNNKQANINSLLNAANQSLAAFNMSFVKTHGLNITQSLKLLLDECDRLMSGNEELVVDTGFKDLDLLLDGMRPGNFIVIGGRPSMGKTTFLLNIIKNVLLEQKLPVLMFSLEMSIKEIMRNLICCINKIQIKELKRGGFSDATIAKMGSAIARLNEVNLQLVDNISTINGVIGCINEHIKFVPNLGLIVIDYLQLISSTKNDNKVIEIGDITRQLKLIAGSAKVPIIALSQLNRQAASKGKLRDDDGGGIEPELAHLRDSGNIEQDADAVMFVHRNIKQTPNKATIYLKKNRHGNIGNVDLAFNGAMALFENLRLHVVKNTITNTNTNNFERYNEGD